MVERKSVSLHWESVSGVSSCPKLSGSCPSKWQQLLAVRESTSQSEEKSDGIYINTTLMAHLVLRRVPGCTTDSQAFDRQSPAHQTRIACQMAERRLRGAQICQTLSDAVVTQAREVKASFHTWLVLDMDGGGRGCRRRMNGLSIFLLCMLLKCKHTHAFTHTYSQTCPHICAVMDAKLPWPD